MAKYAFEGHVSRETPKPHFLLSDPQLELPAGTPEHIRHRLIAYISLLGKWRTVTNLISEASFAQVWRRHVLDCLQLFALCAHARRWLDIGSGAGFPGLILAIQLAEFTDAEVHCVESDSRKCAFLRDVARQLSLPAVIHNNRVQNLDPLSIAPIEAITSRAFASATTILGLSRVYLENGATLLLPRGQTGKHELEGLDRNHYTVESVSNVIHENSVVLRIRIRGEGTG